MRKVLHFFIFITAFFQINEKASAQCTSCTYTATTSGGNFSLNGNETLCITANVSNLNINMNGTGNVICVASGVTWIQDFLTLQGGVTVNVYGTLDNSQQSWSGVSVNGGTACTIDVKAGGTMKTISGGFGNNLTISNSGTLNFTTTNNISIVGSFILNNTATGVVNAMSTPKFEIGNSATVHNYGTINLANCENAEGYLYVHDGSLLKISREFNNHGAFIIEPTGDFQLPCETLSGAAGATVCSFRVGDKGAGKEFIANACIEVMNGNVTFDGPGTLNAGFEIGAGYNLIINKPVTGTNGSFLVKGGTSTINVSGNFIGTNMKFYDVNTAGHDFDSKFGNDPTNYTVSSSAGCNVVPTCTSPTITNVVADTATCNAAIANNNAALHVTGISGMAKYAYGTNGTTGLFAANATASTASSIDVTGLAVPSVSTTYTFRIWASDTTCYNDTTVVLNPSSCACSHIVMSPIPLPAGQIGVPYSVQIVATGGTSPYNYIWRAGTSGVLPNGLSISTSGLVSGTPTSTGTYEVKIIVDDMQACADSLDPAILNILCTYPTIGAATATAATCTSGTANSDAAISITGIVDGASYTYGTNGTTGLIAANATTLSGNSINLTGLSNPATATTYTFRIYSIDTTCYNDTTVVLNPSVCAQIVNLTLSKTVDSSSVSVAGRTVNFTLKVKNISAVNATGVTVKVTAGTGFTYVSTTPSGVYNSGTGIWTVGAVNAGDSATLVLTVKADSIGVNYCTAEINAADQTDINSTPNNGVTTEDDIARACVSVPMPLCPNQTYQAALPNGLTGIQWYKNGSPISGETNQVLTITEVGEYTFTANESTCPVEGCCPIKVVTGTCTLPCKPVICLPVAVVRQ